MSTVSSLYANLYGQLDPYRLPAPVAPKETVQPLDPEEEQSFLGKIGSGALGGVGYVGSVLEKTFGGRAFRGLLGGKPRELLSVLPGSDTLGITDYNDRVSGKDLLGLKDDSWGSTLAGMGVELALDPSLYLTGPGAALSRAGGVAKKIAALPGSVAGRATGSLEKILQATPELRAAAEHAAGGAPQLAGMMQEPLGGLFGVGLPFSKPWKLVGAGQGGADFMSGAGKALGAVDQGLRSIPGIGHQYGWAADKLGQGADILGKYTRANFSAPVMGAVTREGQEVGTDATKLIAPYIAEKSKVLGKIGFQVKDAGVDPLGIELGQLIEGVHPNPAGAHPALISAAQESRKLLDEIRDMKQRLGLTDFQPLSDLEAQYLPRQGVIQGGVSKGHGAPRQPNIPMDPRMGARVEGFRHVVGGREGINQALLNPMVYQGTPLEAADWARSSGLLSPQLTAEELIPQSQAFIDTARSLHPSIRESIGTPTPLRYFGNHPLVDMETYIERVGRLQAHAQATHNLLARTAQLAAPGAQALGSVSSQASGFPFTHLPEGSVNLIDALKEVGMAHGQDELLARLSKQTGSPVTSLFDRYVPAETISEAQRYLRPFSAPEAASAPMQAVDSLTNLTKAWQTAPWFNFHVRNRLSGIWQNLVGGANEAPGGLLQSATDMRNLMAGKELPNLAEQIPGYAANLSAREATRQAALEMYAHRIGIYGPSMGKEVTGPMGQSWRQGKDINDFLSRIPGEEPKTLMDAARTYVGQAPGQEVSWWPWKVQNVFGQTKDLNPLVAGGRKAGDLVEGANRGEMFLALRKQGFSEEAAAQQVLKSHFDYSPTAKTALERQVLGRLIPFYTYARGNIPAQLTQLAEHPGGAAATVAKVAGNLRQQNSFLPDYLGSGLATPIGKEDDGTQRFLTRTDLPPEQAFEMLHGGPHALQGSIMSLLGQVNPLIKAPLEYASGKQFFTGRDLEDLYSQTGSPLVDQIISNSPFSRVATTARTLMDERKWATPGAALALPINLATGLRVSDVDMAKQRNIAEGEYVREMLRGQPEVGQFETIYPKVPLSQLTPQEMLLMRLNANVEGRAREASKAKKQIRVE